VRQCVTVKRPEDVASELEEIRSQLRDRGDAALAEKLERHIADLRGSISAPMPPGGVVTTGEAARALGVRSVNTVKRWAAEGLLQGFRRGGRILISLESVEKLKRTSIVGRQREWEAGLDEALAPFDVGDEHLPPSDVTTLGNKPWEEHATTANDAASSSSR
jgi:excisionase family DNA binding protein